MIDNLVHYFVYSCEYIRGKVHVIRVLNGQQVFLRIVQDICLTQIIHLLHRISHGVNVIDIAELDVTVRVEFLVLNTTTLDTVGMGGGPRACIVDHQLVSGVISVCAANFG